MAKVDHGVTGSLPDLSRRLALRPKEAAGVLGVSERKFRSMLPEIPHVRLEGVVIIPVDSLRGWLRERSETASTATSADRVVNGTLAALREASE